jgi:site-specific DNA recombinase
MNARVPYTILLEIVDISGHKASIHEVLSLETVVGYLRVSTDEQARGYGLDVQRSKVREFAKQERLSVAGIFEDVGVPGSTPLLERKGLAAALDAVKAGEASALVVARHDRLARETLEALLIEREFNRSGARVLYADGGSNGETNELRFMRQVMHAMAEFEKRQLVARLAAARRAKAERGGYAGGRPPFGYRADGGFLYPDEREAPVVKWIFELVANDGASVRGVCRALIRRDAGVRRWHPTQVERILRRDLYKRGPVGSRIVDPKVWNRAAGVLAARRPR